MTVDKEAADRLALSFGADAARYDRTRPAYPDVLVRKIVSASPGPRVLDVGCGTGVLSRPLRAAGCEVLGVEPDERMAGFARGTGVAVEVAKFETWDPAGREFDAVVAGQSWHWVDAEAGPRHVARVLRPGGVFVALWHVYAPPEPIEQAFTDAFRKVAPDVPIRLGQSREEALRAYREGCARTGEAFVATGAFSGAEQWAASWDHTYTTAEYLDLVRTMGPLALLNAEQVDGLLDDVGSALDAAGGRFETRYDTLAVAVTRG
ncbi:Ubiquinone/menaquinone biosynthesis C-methylase UbiE [Lentzea xinjiangensis]|uniref:Ubiquinone/menaquinone biosynthesis C-methylase UbiE n=1 Tax=Lentzea xinjiangensis TaxID=402600 RepID=A0A1H9IAC7_9PSEU|nr:class I SAM-dependent methyltransferase [Lentzea xinjiangensis]SEQ71527.1 Ubiquinone/menaquinone biosynthesis C-methylase UbiE [Lentzea xinjiangensis]